MRIIAGTHRSRKILPPPGRTTRPITDRVKESVFDVLAGRPAGARVADLFAGTGSLGLEALSRGAEFCLFAESDRHALRLLRENIRNLGLEEKTQISSRNAWHFAKWAGTEGPFDLIFLDPPYAESRDSNLESPLGRLLVAISAGDLLAGDGVLVLRHEAAYACGQAYANLVLQQSRRYGAMAVSFLTPASPDGK